MKSIILKENLLKGLSIVERSIGENSHLPILQAVKIAATKDNQLILTGTNLETAVVSIVSGRVETAGEVAVSFRVLRDILKNLTAEKVHLVSEENTLSLQADNYEASVSLENVEEFPIIPSLQDKRESLTLSAGALKNLFQKALVATQYSEVRPEINGVYVEAGDAALICAGTDSFRLVEVRAGKEAFSSSFGEKKTCIVPLRTADVLLRIFDADEELNVFFDDNQALFESASTALISRLIDGTFPNYRNVIPRAEKLGIHVKRKELENALKVTSVFSGKTRDVLFSLDERGKVLHVSSRDQSVGENTYRVPVRVTGDGAGGMRISFNWKYILDGISLYESDEVTMHIVDSSTPLLIRGKDEDNIVYVAAPIRE